MKSNLILIIEDENEVRFHLEDYFRDKNFPVLSVGNGKQGLQILETFPVLPNLIILDNDMPVMNGMEFRIQQIANHHYNHIKVIFMSEKVSDEEVAVGLGMKFCKKPINLPALLEIVHSL